MKKRRMATTAIAAFGAAMTSIYAAPELQADILDLTFTPGTIPFLNLSFISIDQVGAGFSQWNFFEPFGKDLYAGSLGGVALLSSSSSLNPDTFAGSRVIDFNGFSNGIAFVGFSFSGPGIAPSPGGFSQNVGWFSLNLGGQGGAITFLEGEYGNAGETVHVGGTRKTPIIPEPTTSAALSVLALGAAGIRRNRKK